MQEGPRNTTPPSKRCSACLQSLLFIVARWAGGRLLAPAPARPFQVATSNSKLRFFLLAPAFFSPPSDSSPPAHSMSSFEIQRRDVLDRRRLRPDFSSRLNPGSARRGTFLKRTFAPEFSKCLMKNKTRLADDALGHAEIFMYSTAIRFSPSVSQHSGTEATGVRPFLPDGRLA